jgi:nitrous oxidase accessory protein NosD
MQRRSVLPGLLILSGPFWPKIGRANEAGITPGGALQSSADGQVIENQDIMVASGNALTVTHQGVTVRNCRIRHGDGHGIHAVGASGLSLRNVEVERINPVTRREPGQQFCNNINLYRCPGASLRRVKVSGGSSNVYIELSDGCRLGQLELHDARGPYPRGQNLQLNQSPNSVIDDFSAENGPMSWTEDNISVFRSDRCIVRNGLVSYNNSPTGDGVMLEGSSDCVVEDVDAVQQGNGAFAAVPVEDAGSGGCVFRRCRTRTSYNGRRDGRARPESNSLSFYVLSSPGARKHTLVDCHYADLANFHNLVWDGRALNAGWSLTPRAFTPRRPLRLDFNW